MKTLHASGNALADPDIQLGILEGDSDSHCVLPAFEDKLDPIGLFPLRPTGIDILQVNLGYMCNQTCKHCHVDAGPDRKEIMTRQTMEHCLEVLRDTDIKIVDLTGGAPEMNPHFRWFVEQIRALGRHVMVRCNLTILTVNPKYRELPEFFRNHQVEVVSSLPFYSAAHTDRQRGDGVFERSIEALQMLNAVGYGKPGSGLMLNLVYNPNGAFLPAPQSQLERDFKRQLEQRHGVLFNNLFCITNMPISRFLEFLIVSGNYDAYMEKLVNAFNPAAASGVMCRNTLSVGWDGWLYDCDFNQMLELKVDVPSSAHISSFSHSQLSTREIVVKRHCFGCTAGAGSSCGGNTTTN
jgi:radical SAM/Cys-rich protein